MQTKENRAPSGAASLRMLAAVVALSAAVMTAALALLPETWAAVVAYAVPVWAGAFAFLGTEPISALVRHVLRR